jgi:hypothetical protein
MPRSCDQGHWRHKNPRQDPSTHGRGGRHRPIRGEQAKAGANRPGHHSGVSPVSAERRSRHSLRVTLALEEHRRDAIRQAVVEGLTDFRTMRIASATFAARESLSLR